MSMRLLAGVPVSPLGLGCMNLSHAYGTPPDAARGAALLRRALDLGVRHFDTAALYGFGRNESLLGEVLPAHRNEIFLASKCGMQGVDGKRVIDGRPETLRESIDRSLQRLGTDHLDLCYLHRWDKQVPIEDSVGALSGLVRTGKIRAIGLSEVSVATLRRAQAVHPVAAVQSEYSLWSRNAELGMLEECRRIGAAFVAFSPLGRGFLADDRLDPGAFVAQDIRRAMPRFQEPAWSANAAVLPRFRALAAEAGRRPAQLALAWLLTRAPHIIAIPGTASIAHLEENLGALRVSVPATVLQAIDALINSTTVHGMRYPPAVLAEVDTEEFSGHA